MQRVSLAGVTRTIRVRASAADDLELALELADVADSITLARFRADGPRRRDQAGPDARHRGRHRRRAGDARADSPSDRPEDAVVGEEYGASGDSDAGRRWIVDPIDGTKNYVRGMPVWATLLALQDDGRPWSGSCRRRRSDGGGGRRGASARSRPTGCRDEPRRLQVSAVRALEDAQLCSRGSTGGTSRPVDRLLALARRCWRTRGFGDFWTYMLVAEGAAEIGCEAVVSLWDLAAPQVIVEEAGGRFTDLAGVRTADGGDALATNGLLHEATLAIIGR